MTAPTPRQFDLACAEALAHIRKRLESLPALYLDAYEASGWKPARDSAGKISRGSVSDPTAEAAGDPRDPRRPGAQRSIRVALENARGHLADAENAVGAIEVEVMKAMDRLDPREGFELPRYPVTINNAEYDEAVRAQERRKEGIA